MCCNPASEIIVSIIIPIYNFSVNLIETINSVQIQTENRIEIIIFDFSSDYSAKELIFDLAKNDARIKYFNCANKGTREKQLFNCIYDLRGSWVAFINDGDSWNPVKIEEQLFVLYKLNKKICCTNAFEINNGINAGDLLFEKKDKILKFRHILNENHILFTSLIIHRSLIDHQWFNDKMNAEITLWQKIILLSEIIYLGDPLVGSSNSYSLTNKQDYNCNMGIIKFSNDFCKWLKAQKIGVKIKFYKELVLYMGSYYIEYPVKKIFRSLKGIF